MAKQSKLEKIGFQKRSEDVRNDINKNVQYDAEHPYALSPEVVPNGKGKGSMHGGHGHALPGDMSNTYSIDIENGGGEYDINGRPGVDGGRKWLQAHCIYNKENQYGVDAIDTEANREEGQFFIK